MNCLKYDFNVLYDRFKLFMQVTKNLNGHYPILMNSIIKETDLESTRMISSSHAFSKRLFFSYKSFFWSIPSNICIIHSAIISAIQINTNNDWPASHI